MRTDPCFFDNRRIQGCKQTESRPPSQQTSPSKASMTTQSWPPACRSALSSCTCCCILTPHTHLSDAAGYPHLNHIIRFPKSESEIEVPAWFHCPHCPCTLGLAWVHPNEMPAVEESVSSASWLPRVADFKEYRQLFEPPKSPVNDSPMEDCRASSSSPDQFILGDRTNMLQQTSSTPVVHRKVPIDGPRKSARKSRPLSRSTVVNTSGGESPPKTPEYKPRKSKYDIR